MPSSTASVSPSASALGHERVERVGLLEHLVGDRQPAEAVGRPPACPRAPTASRRAARSGARRPRRRRALTRSASGCSSSAGRSASIVGRAPGDDRLALALDAVEQLRHRHHERLDAVAQQLRRDVVEVDAGVAQRVEVGLRVVGGGRAGRPRPTARRGQQRRQRHRVDRVRPDEAVDVERLGVARVLDAGRGPQRALDGAARLAQRARSARPRRRAGRRGRRRGRWRGRRGPASSVWPSASRRLSTSVSTRETKNEATEWRSSGLPSSWRRSIARTNASMMRS